MVEPRVGAYPELIEATGGGVLYEPNTAGALAEALGALLADESRRSALGRQARDSVVRSFSLATMAEKMKALYTGLAPRRTAVGGGP